MVFQQVKIRKYELKKSTFYLLKKQNQNPASKISKTLASMSIFYLLKLKNSFSASKKAASPETASLGA